MQPTLAIDFGTTHSLVGAVTGDRVHQSLPLDPHAHDPSVMRTLLYFPHADQCFYGAQALTQFVENELEGRLFRSFKSHLPSKTYLGTMVGDRPLPLDRLVGLFLLELKKRSEENLQQKFERVLLGRPARYSMDEESHQIALHRMRKAAEFAGFKQVDFLEEPVAAAYSLKKSWAKPQLVLIVDLGGGTSDFSVVRLNPSDNSKDEVLGVYGISVAGDALEEACMKTRLAPMFGSELEYRVPMSNNVLRMPPAVHEKLCYPAHIVHLKDRDTYEFLRNTQKWAVRDTDRAKLHRLFVLMEDQQIYSLFEEIERVKRALSESPLDQLNFPYPEIEIGFPVTRAEFDQWTATSLGRVIQCLHECLQQAQVTPQQIDLVCLTGGTAKVPAVHAQLKAIFGAEKLSTAALFHSVLHGLVAAAAAQGAAN